MAAPSTFVLKLRHGIWRVTLDGVFYGDYRSQSSAREGIAEAQLKLPVLARVVQVEDEGL